VIQMVDGGGSYFFNTIDEALSHPGIPPDASFSDLRESLLTLDRGCEYTEVAGLWWRILDGEPDMQPSRLSVVCDNVSRSPEVAYVKEDLVSGERTLLGFKHVEVAFEDWRKTIEGSIFSYQGPRTIAIFKSFYLDGERNVDGMRWRSVSRNVVEAPPAAPVRIDVLDEEKTTGHVIAPNEIDKVAMEESQIAPDDGSTPINNSAAFEEDTEASLDDAGFDAEESEQKVDAEVGDKEANGIAADSAFSEAGHEKDFESVERSSSEVFDLETLSPSENVKPAVKPVGGMLNGLVRRFAPLARLRSAPKEESPEKEAQAVR